VRGGERGGGTGGGKTWRPNIPSIEGEKIKKGNTGEEHNTPGGQGKTKGGKRKKKSKLWKKQEHARIGGKGRKQPKRCV